MLSNHFDLNHEHKAELAMLCFEFLVMKVTFTSATHIPSWNPEPNPTLDEGWKIHPFH